ncbi:MAG: sialidase family protein [Thermomicrobiaceae bacterium]
MTSAFLGTSSGVSYLTNGTTEHVGLGSERISAIHAVELGGGKTRILAGTYENGLFTSDDEGRSWNEGPDGFWAFCVRWLGDDPLKPGDILAGTEPGRIFRSDDRGLSWNELDGIREIEGHENWYLPYSPRAGAVRNIYSPAGSNRYLASVEVGGLLESDDGGKSWTCRHVGVDSDIHYVTGHPNDGSVLFAALGYAGIDHTPNEDGPEHRGGLARSTDSGQTWTKLFGDYTRGVIIPPTRTDIVIAGPSPDVGRNGRIEVSRDGGDSWEDASAGIDTPMPDMIEVFVPAPDGSIWAICSGGRLLSANPDELVWRDVLNEADSVRVQSVAYV